MSDQGIYGLINSLVVVIQISALPTRQAVDDDEQSAACGNVWRGRLSLLVRFAGVKLCVVACLEKKHKDVLVLIPLWGIHRLCEGLCGPLTSSSVRPSTNNRCAHTVVPRGLV